MSEQGHAEVVLEALSHLSDDGRIYTKVFADEARTSLRELETENDRLRRWIRVMVLASPQTFETYRRWARKALDDESPTQVEFGVDTLPSKQP